MIPPKPPLKLKQANSQSPIKDSNINSNMNHWIRKFLCLLSRQHLLVGLGTLSNHQTWCVNWWFYGHHSSTVFSVSRFSIFNSLISFSQKTNLLANHLYTCFRSKTNLPIDNEKCQRGFDKLIIIHGNESRGWRWDESKVKD
jgi:hypothetical protein